MDKIDLDEFTVANLKEISNKREELVKAIQIGDQLAQTILTTVINVKGLKGDWSLGNDGKTLIKNPEGKKYGTKREACT